MTECFILSKACALSAALQDTTWGIPKNSAIEHSCMKLKRFAQANGIWRSTIDDHWSLVTNLSRLSQLQMTHLVRLQQPPMAHFLEHLKGTTPLPEPEHWILSVHRLGEAPPKKSNKTHHFLRRREPGEARQVSLWVWCHPFSQALVAAEKPMASRRSPAASAIWLQSCRVLVSQKPNCACASQRSCSACCHWRPWNSGGTIGVQGENQFLALRSSWKNPPAFLARTRCSIQSNSSWPTVQPKPWIHHSFQAKQRNGPRMKISTKEKKSANELYLNRFPSEPLLYTVYNM